MLPLREGSSVPALVEGDDLGLYVVKLRGAGQGPKALIAELVAGELARALGLTVPELVFVELDRALADSEPDPELCLPLEASAGRNIGLDYLPGSITADPAVGAPPPSELASRIVLFDALVANVDRTPRNPNLLTWHRRLWLIDHGAALYFHHGWKPQDSLDGASDPFAEVAQHVLLPWATELSRAAAHVENTLSTKVFERIVSQIPDAWLDARDGFSDHQAHRAAYPTWLATRLLALPLLLKEAEDARARRI